ncbi:hypothetical protein ZIOFF_058478 [Zingiber officinale]|uniref:Uncharacterized protein n=1 Tax=Zingiber officinale TaxID=94328 RepID=A0A8J5F7Q2_ZINOF|nr:hypothetical protein ZIOFF_058478 [Zingiber officinale]
MVVLVNANPSDAEGEANSFADQLADFHPTDTVFLHLEDEKGGRSTGTTVIGDSSSALHGWLALSDDYNKDSHIGRYLRKHGELKTVKQVTEEKKKKNGKLVANLAYVLDVKNKQLHDLEVRNNKTNFFIHQPKYEKAPYEADLVWKQRKLVEETHPQKTSPSCGAYNKGPFDGRSRLAPVPATVADKSKSQDDEWGNTIYLSMRATSSRISSSMPWESPPLKTQHLAFARFLQHDLAYPLPWEDLNATVGGGAVPATIVATNSEPPHKEELLH